MPDCQLSKRKNKTRMVHFHVLVLVRRVDGQFWPFTFSAKYYQRYDVDVGNNRNGD